MIQTNGLTLLGAGPAVTTIRGGQFGNVIQTAIQTDECRDLCHRGIHDH